MSTWLRHTPRHVHATVLNYVRGHLETLGWTDQDTVPFGTANSDPITLVDTPAITGDAKLVSGVESGIVACTIGDEFAPSDQELGGPLSLQEYPIFFDVLQKTDAAAKALAADIRDILLGRLDGTVRSLPLVNQVTGEEVPGWVIELDDVERVGPLHKFPLHWQVIKVTAAASFPEVRY